MTKLELAIRYDIEHDLFHSQNVLSDEYVTPTFIKYVAELEGKNKELREKNVELIKEADERYRGCQRIDDDNSRIILDLKVKVKDLEKENAELKDNLTKAKELLNMFLRLHYRPIIDECTLHHKVEQFLKGEKNEMLQKL